MLAAGWTNIAFVEAVLGGNILRVLLLFYLSPLWAVILGWLILRERPSRVAIVSLFIAMGGALIMLWDGRMGFPWPSSLPDWYALSSGFAFAFSNVITRKARHLSLSAKVLSVWGGVVVLGVVIILSSRIAMPAISLQTFLAAAGLGVGRYPVDDGAGSARRYAHARPPFGGHILNRAGGRCRVAAASDR